MIMMVMMVMMMMVIIIMLKNVAAQIGPRTRTHTLCGPAQSKRMSRFLQEPLYAQVKCRKPKPRRRLCASLRSRSACQNFTRATSHTEIYRTNAAAQMGPRTRTHTLCASLRSRNACQDFTRATLYRNLEVKCRRPEWAPWSSTGLYYHPQCGSSYVSKRKHGHTLMPLFHFKFKSRTDMNWLG